MFTREIIFCLGTYLQPHELIKYTQINKLFYKVLKNNLLWYKYIDSKYLKLFESKSYAESYKKYYLINKLIKQGRYFSPNFDVEKLYDYNNFSISNGEIIIR